MPHRSTFYSCAAGRVEADLDGSGFAGVPADESPILERGQVGVNGLRRGKSHRVADFSHGRGVATVTDLTVDEIKDLLLAAGKSRVAHVEVSCLWRWVSGAGLSGDLLCHLTSNRCSIQ